MALMMNRSSQINRICFSQNALSVQASKMLDHPKIILRGGDIGVRLEELRKPAVEAVSKMRKQTP